MLFLSPCLPSQFYLAQVLLKLSLISVSNCLSYISFSWLSTDILVMPRLFICHTVPAFTKAVKRKSFREHAVSFSNFSHGYFFLKLLGSSNLGISLSLIAPVVLWYNSYPSWVKLVPLWRLPRKTADFILVIAISGNQRCCLTVESCYVNPSLRHLGTSHHHPCMIFEMKEK